MAPSKTSAAQGDLAGTQGGEEGNGGEADVGADGEAGKGEGDDLGVAR